jgi:glycosyltransferase involved in cell wall biosynthesis
VTRKLSILHTESSTGWGGQEIRILTEIKGFLERGHQVTLICPPQAELTEAARNAGIGVASLSIDRKNLTGLMSMRSWLSQRLAQYDIINTHSSTDSWLTALTVATFRGKKPIVRTRHVSTAVNRSASTRWLYQRATRHIVTTGEALRLQLHRDNGYRLESMTSVPTGIDLARFRPLDRAACKKSLGLDATVNFVGIVATLRDWKGHCYLFDAMARLAPRLQNWQLLVIGDGPHEPTLRAKVVELNLHTNVKFVGRQQNIPEWLNALDLFVLPSYGDEGVPQAIVQAMACGLPVISTPIGSIAEAVIDRGTGLLVPPRDSNALERAMEHLMQNPGLRSQYGAAGVEQSRDKFSLDQMLNRMETVFNSVVGAG